VMLFLYIVLNLGKKMPVLYLVHYMVNSN
jgi:hypothetical protein